MPQNLDKYKTEDWSVLEHDTDAVMRRAKMLRVRFGFLGILALLAMALIRTM